LEFHLMNFLRFSYEPVQKARNCIDSRPIWANVNGYKHKRCSCQDQSKCTCEKTFSDPDATYGVQRNKANQNRFFIGYRKHLIVCPSPKGPIVLFSIILPNNTADVKVMLPLIEMMKKIELKQTSIKEIPIIVKIGAVSIELYSGFHAETLREAIAAIRSL